MGHTPTPWRVEADERNYEVGGKLTSDTYIAGYNIYDASGSEIVGCEGITDATDENAAYIVECVNSHASLVEEVERLRELLRRVDHAFDLTIKFRDFAYVAGTDLREEIAEALEKSNA